jgi:hypothetical protein
MDTLSIFFLILSALVPLAIIGGVLFLIVTLTKKKDGKNTEFKLSAKTLFQIYLYLISFITLIFTVIGAANITKAGLSYPFGIDFSYTLYKAQSFEEGARYDYPPMKADMFQECTNAEPVSIDGTRFCVDYGQRTSDLINGVTMLLSMSILFLIHQLMITRIDPKKTLPWLQKLYTFASLILYSVMGIISIPVSIYQLTNYLIFQPETYTYSTPTAPAMAIAVALLSVPLWIFFLVKTSNLKEE